MLFSCCLVLLLVGFAQAVPAPGHGVLVGYCDRTDQCDVGECCRSFIQPRGRRVVLDNLDPDLMRFTHGSCRKTGTDGSYCFINPSSTGMDGLYYDCPCATGYVCVASGEMALDKGEPGVCRPASKVSTLNQECSSGADCAATECCVSNTRPIGKRSTRYMTHGHCANMGVSGSGCLVKYGSGKPNGTSYMCPCTSGLTCHGTGRYDVPLGEMGRCGP